MNAVAYQLDQPNTVRDTTDLLDELQRLNAAVALLLDNSEDAAPVDRMTWSDIAGAFNALRHHRVAPGHMLALARTAIEDMLDPSESCSAIGREELCALFAVMARANAWAAELLRGPSQSKPSPPKAPTQKTTVAARDRAADVVDLFPPTSAT